MLLLTRKNEQSIKIGDNIVVTILAISGGRIKIGIDAPIEVPVLRDSHQTENSIQTKNAIRTRTN